MIRSARLACLWGLAITTTGAAIAAALVAHSRGLPQADGRFADVFSLAAIVSVAALILTIHPGHRVGRIMLVGGCLWGLAAPAVEWGVANAIERPDPFVIGVAVVALTFRGAGWLLLIGMLALVFPDGSLPGRRWRWVPYIAAASLGAFAFGSLFQPYPIDVRVESLPNPLALPGAGGAVAEVAFLLGFTLGLVAAAAGLIAMCVRWWRADALGREQIGWFVLACLVVPAVMAFALRDLSTALPYPLAVAALPAAIGFAVLQRRLYGFDHFLRRTLLYVVLTTAVLAVYLLAVAGAGSMIGVREGWWLGLVGALAVAVAAEPMRRTLQRGANRLVHGDWEDPYDVARRLGLRLSDAATPQSTLDAALVELASALRLRWVAIEYDGERMAEVGERSDSLQPDEFALLNDGEPVGLLTTVTDRRLRPRDRALLEALARQIAPVVQAHRLTAELRRSRDRLVLAQQEERRRLRRDLHDGLGATLAALTFKVDTARNVLAAEPSAEQLLLEIRDGLRHTVDDVRRLIDGLRPPHLDELGLDGALARLARELTGPTEIRIRIDGAPQRLSLTEVAAYRIAQEALTNVVRHAQARSCEVVLAYRHATLELSVTDDGSGASAIRDGHGLATMRERAEELGGTLAVASRPGHGTAVTAVIPRS